MSDLSFGFETLQCRSLNQMAGKQLLFHKRNLSTFYQIWYPRNVHSPCIGALFCLWYLLLYSCNKQRWSHGRHFELLLSTKGHFGRGRVLHTLSDDILDPHIYSSDLLLTNLQWSKKKKKKEKWDVCPWMKCTWKKAGVNICTKFYLMWNPQAPSHFPDNTQAFAIKLHTRSAGLWMPGLMVFLFYLAKDASTFTKSESDCSGMQRTGTERHQGSFRFYLFSGDLKQEVLPYLSFLLHQIAPLLLPCRSFFSARHFQEKLDSWCFRAWYSSQKNGTIICFV